MGSSPTTTTMSDELGKLVKETLSGDVVIRILPPPAGKSPYAFTRVHRIRGHNAKCPVCDYEKELTEKQKANGAGGRRKKKFRSIDEPWGPSDEQAE